MIVRPQRQYSPPAPPGADMGSQAGSSSTPASADTRRVVSIHDDVFAIDNIGFEPDDTDNQPPTFVYPTSKLRKASAPAYLDDIQRLRRQSRLPSSATSAVSGAKRMSMGMPRYLAMQSYNNGVVGSGGGAKVNNGPPLPPGSPLKAADSASVFSYSVQSDESAMSAQKREFTFELLAMIGSIFYGLLLVVLAGVFYLTDMTSKTSGKHQLFK